MRDRIVQRDRLIDATGRRLFELEVKFKSLDYAEMDRALDPQTFALGIGRKPTPRRCERALWIISYAE
jgi:hypothetical protein